MSGEISSPLSNDRRGKKRLQEPGEEEVVGQENEESPPRKEKVARLAEDGVEVITKFPLKFGRLAISVGSLVDFRGDVVVNAANKGCLGGGGVDGAISSAGGEALAEARKNLPILDDESARCLVGSAVWTIGGDLAAKWCVHAVGPNYNSIEDTERGDELLASAYESSMKACSELGAKTVAFSLLSAGIFRGKNPLENVLAIAIKAIAKSAYPDLDVVHLVAFTPKERSTLVETASRFFNLPLREGDGESDPSSGESSSPPQPSSKVDEEDAGAKNDEQ